MMKKTLIILGCGILLAGGLYVVRTKPVAVVSEPKYQTKEVMLGNARYTLQIADTDFLRERGLSYRGSLAPQTGMLFIFDTPRISRFWMKDMNFPLDIIWLDADKKVVHIEHSLSPSTYPDSFGPDTPTQYVIELNAGEVKRIGFVLGTKVNF